MTAAFGRRQLVQLGAVVAGGWAVGGLLRRTGAIGRDVGRGAAAIDDRGSPGSGPVTASVRLAVFSDYRCPACRHAFPAMEAAVRADGDVRIVYKDWPIFGAPSERAARIALASVEQGIYPAVHRRLMTDDRGIDDAMLADVVTAAGGDWQRAVARAASDRDRITARLRANGMEALALGPPGTPGYLAGSILVVGAIDERDFARLFARARGG